MSRTLRTAVALVIASLAVMPMSAESEPNLEGWYVAEGFDTDGTRYRALVALRRDAQSYRVTMFVSQPSEAAEPELAAIGVALQSGDVLAVNYYTPDHARLAVYRIEGQGRLTGQWILVGGDGTAHAETLTRISDALSMAKVPSLAPACVQPADPGSRLFSLTTASTRAVIRASIGGSNACTQFGFRAAPGTPRVQRHSDADHLALHRSHRSAARGSRPDIGRRSHGPGVVRSDSRTGHARPSRGQ